MARGIGARRRMELYEDSGYFEWNASRELAARMLAEGTHTISEICATLDTNYQTISDWRKHPQFQERVREIAQEIVGDIQTYIVSARQETAKRSQEIVDELWHVAKNSKSGQARVAALNTLATIAGLLQRGGDGTQVNVQVNNQMNPANPETVEIIEAPYDVVVHSDEISRRDVE